MFLEKVVIDVLTKYPDFSPEKMIFVVPNKRATLFLKKYFSKHINKICQSPRFLSMESWVEQIAQYQIMPNMSLLFELYNTYLANNDTPDDFETFVGWGQTLLQDFNEIDQYLINPNDIFPYIKAIKEVEHWSLSQELTPMQEKHLAFWNTLGLYYRAFSEKLTLKKQGYRGFVYRKATQKINSYIEKSKDKLHIFAGFNALTQSEEILIESVLLSTTSEIYWDIDKTFLSDNQHDAGYFIRQYFSRWKYYNNRERKWEGDDFSSEKNINIVGVPKSVNQAHYVGKLVNQIPDFQWENTAIILADENLLLPVIQSINKNKLPMNITMGYPLKQTSTSSLFSAFFKLYTSNNWYYKDVENLLQQPLIQRILSKDSIEQITQHIRHKNWVYISKNQLVEQLSLQDEEIINILFSDSKSITAKLLIEQCFNLIFILKNKLEEEKETNALLLEYLYRFYELFNQLYDLENQYSFLITPKTLYYLYNELLVKQTLDFQGEPLQGLQLMGMLECQNLDFENVIIVSVNEGILPAGKSVNSFIPFDVKNNLGLPTYKHRDAIFTYHFYRLLQRAKNIHLVYNTETDGFKGGEKSRFILQLLTQQADNLHITETILTPQVIASQFDLMIIEKDENVMTRLKEIASGRGFSPSALTTYIRNPIDFYKQNILQAREERDVEEIMEARTFGDIVHATLEALFSPYLGKILTIESIHSMKENVPFLIDKYFKELYKEEENLGKNTLIFSVIQEYIEQFLEMEKRTISHTTIEILALEKDLITSVRFPEFDFDICLRGTADRIERRNGQLYIVDYKTGKVEQRNITLNENGWQKLITDFNYNKAFQLLMYAYILKKENQYTDNEIFAGNYSFKNLESNFLGFRNENDKTPSAITDLISNRFEEKLKELLLEIFDPNIPFLEKKI